MMILDSLIDGIYKKAAVRKIEDVRIGLGYTAVLLDNGSCGLAYTFRNELGYCCCILKEAGQIKGLKCGDVIQWVKDANLARTAVGLATINALIQEDVLKVTQSDIFKEWEKQLAEENDIRVLSFNWYDGARHFLTNKPAKTPADLKGVRVRTPGAPVWSESVKAMGATPVSMPWTEVYQAMQQKAIDGAEGQHTASYTSRLYEVIKYIDKTAHFQLVNGIIVGEKWFKTLPAEYQQILLDETKAVAAENARLIEELSDEYESKMVEAGMEVVEVDIEAFKAAADEAYDVLGFRELREKIYAQIGKK